VDGVEVESYTRDGSVDFSTADKYNALDGVSTYRGNNYRSEPSFGTADITQEKLTLLDIDKTTMKIGRWGGSACTGQPLVVTWTGQTLVNMEGMLKDEFKGRDELTEVIIASADGNIYFMELSTGEKTRDFIKIGSPTKGTPSLDPRGYPIIYVGQGLNPEGSTTACNDMYFRAYSLIDGELLYSFGAATKDPVAYRNWQAYDASPLIDAATDTLIEPGENGVLYTAKLNTDYDEAAGTLTMNPDPLVKYTYTSTRNESAYNGRGVWGMENSPVGWRNYVFFTDNAGMLQCVDLNTMELVYANDMGNDSDVSMILEEDIENDTFYLYTASEFDDTVVNATNSTGASNARKINGLTGEIIWEKAFSVYTAIDGSVDGGILSSPILGKEGTTMEGLIIYTVSSLIKDDGSKTAMVVALDKLTGELVWQVDMENTGWTPSSPAPVYTDDGQGYIVQCLYKGTIKLIKADADSASVVDSINISEELGSEEANSFEATPVVYGNTIVVGSRSQHFFFLNID
jgi:outer membrane protein assembly factor BamB